MTNHNLNVGFIGLGHMGSPMAARLIDAGFNLTVFDSNSKTMEEFVSRHGGRPAAAVPRLGAGAQVVITMLPDGDVVRQVVLDDGPAADDPAVC